MNRHVVAAIFLGGFLLAAIAMLLVQHSGAANGALMAGFMAPLEQAVHCACLVAIGCVAAVLAREMAVLLPLCSVLMLLLGAFSHLDVQSFPQVQFFTVGAILLFALAMSLMRHRASLLSVAPIAAWAYFTGSAYMRAVPADIPPLFFLVGVVQSAALLIAIGVTLSVSLMEFVIQSLRKLKAVSAIASFLTLF